MRVARRACFLCAKRAPPPTEKAAARLPTTKKSRALGPGQTRTTPPDLASRACLCPRRSTRGLPFRNNTKDKERPRIRVHTARTKKERRGRGGGAALLLEGGAERCRVPGYPSGTLRPGTYNQIKVATRPTGNQTRELLIRHANRPQDGPRRQTRARRLPRSIASIFPRLERVGGRRARGESRCVPPFQLHREPYDFSSRISCHITFFVPHQLEQGNLLL